MCLRSLHDIDERQALMMLCIGLCLRPSRLRYYFVFVKVSSDTRNTTLDIYVQSEFPILKYFIIITIHVSK